MTESIGKSDPLFRGDLDVLLEAERQRHALMGLLGRTATRGNQLSDPESDDGETIVRGER